MKFNPWHLKFSLMYACMVPFVNWGFANTRFFTLPDGGSWSPLSVIVGLVLVVRDFSQQEIGRYVFIPLVIGCYFSYVLGTPEIAIASVCAFAASEVVDWIVYSYTNRPLSDRVLISSLVGIPIDTGIFLYGANMAIPGFFSWWTLATMLISKAVGVLVVFAILREREKTQLKSRS